MLTPNESANSFPGFCPTRLPKLSLALRATSRRRPSLGTRLTKPWENRDKTMQKCTADGIYLYMEIIFKVLANFTLFLFISCLFCSWVVQRQMKIVLYIILFFNRIRCKYGCGDDEDWKNYEIDMYSERYQAQSLSRVNRNPVYWYKLFQLKDRGSTVWSITKVGAI